MLPTPVTRTTLAEARAGHPATGHPPPPAAPAQADARPASRFRERQAGGVPFTQVPVAVLRAAGLPAGSRLLYSRLCAYRRQDPTCWPRQSDLAHQLGPATGVRTVQRLLQPLRAAQWLTSRRAGARQHYTCLVPLRPGGFVQIPTQLLRAAHLSMGARLLYGVLFSYRGRAGIYPGQARLAADLGVTSTRTIRRFLAELAEAGYLTWIKGGRGQTNRYHLTLPPATPPDEGTPASPAPPARTCQGREPQPPAGPPHTPRRSGQQATPVSAQQDATQPDPNITGDSKALPPCLIRQTTDPARHQLRPYLADLARELGDDSPPASSLTRATNLFRQSGLEWVAFLALLQEARRVTQQRTAQIQKRRGTAGGGQGKNKMPYFFAVLADRVRTGPGPTAPPLGPGPGVKAGTPRDARRPASAPQQGRGGPPARARLQARPSVAYSPLIAGAVLDLARTLHDELAGPVAVERALQLWQQSAWREETFLTALQGAARQQRSVRAVLHVLAAQFAPPEQMARPAGGL
jgi:hypothetical protein